MLLVKNPSQYAIFDLKLFNIYKVRRNNIGIMAHQWDQRYSAEEYLFGVLPNEWFEEKLKIMRPGKILLPGEGEGRNAVWAATQGWQVTAFDQSYEAKSKALKLASENEVELKYLVKDLRCFREEEGSYDVIALIYVHMPSEYRTKVHNDLLKMLKPGGCLIFEAFSKSQISMNSGGPKDIDMLYSPEDLKSDFSEMKIMEFYDIKVHLAEGELHKGHAEIIRIFARKPK